VVLNDPSVTPTPIDTATPAPSETVTPSVTGSATPAPTSTLSPNANAPEVAVLDQYSDSLGNDITVPKLVAEKSSAVVDSINKAIVDFATDAKIGNYKTYTAGLGGTNYMELKCYALEYGDYINIVLTKQVFPTYGTYGAVTSFVYDFKDDTQKQLQDAIKADDLDLTDPETKLLKVSEQSLTIDTFKPVAFITTQPGNIYFYEVHYKPVSGDNGLYALYARYPDGSYEPYDGKSLPLDPVKDELITLSTLQ
jgi:hypothetical protein